MNPENTGRGHRRTAPARKTLAALAATLLLAAGCASQPAPTGQLRAAEQAIDDAERAQAAEHAPSELSQARAKLASANAAVQGEDMERAARLADEARVDAELAAARTAAAKALAANEEIRRGTQVLMQEIERNTGGTP